VSHTSILSDILCEVGEKTYPKLEGWVNEVFSDTLYGRAIESIKLKEDYERALFVFLGYQSLKKERENSIDAMAALELLDSSLLIVDDIVDDAPRRKGKEAVHKSWGVGNAIILANMLKSTSLLALLRSAEINNLDDKELRELLNFFETTYNDMYIGEYLDLNYESMSFEEVSIDNYLEMIKRTTGIHFGMAIRTGGILAKSSKNILAMLWEIGVRLGTILQIRDDFMDYIDDENITHKPAFGDFKRNKKRLPLILAYHFSPEKVRRLQYALFDNSIKRDLQLLVSHTQIKNEALKIVNKIYTDTDDLINKIESSIVRQVLQEFSNLVRSL